jgi:3-dehydrosphinganine reductase
MNLWLVAQREGLLDSARKEVESYCTNQNQEIRTYSADVCNHQQVQDAVGLIINDSHAPSILINSAGAAHPGYVQNLELDIFNWMMSVNYFGTVHMTKAVLPYMLQQGSGYIVNISSLGGTISIIGYTAYSGSKFAVRGFTDALRQEMKLHGIGVSLVLPSDVDTPQLEYENRIKPPETKALGSISGSMSSQAVAKTIVAGVERGKYLIIPGTEGKVLYHLAGLLGGGINPIIDMIIADAVKKKTNTHQKEA